MLEGTARGRTNWTGGAVNYGLVSGTVKENYDKNEPGRVKVEYYLGEQGMIQTGWIPVMTNYVADKAGVYMLPEIGTEVVIGFLGGRKDCPVVLGTLWCKDVNRPENAVHEKNFQKVIRTKGGHEIRFSDEEKKQKLTITTPGELTVSMEDENTLICLRDKDSKNLVKIDGKNGEIEVKADKKISLTVGSTKIQMESDKISIKSSTVEGDATQSLKLKGQSTAIQGSQVQIKADANMTVQAGGMTEVKGSMVKIN